MISNGMKLACAGVLVIGAGTAIAGSDDMVASSAETTKPLKAGVKAPNPTLLNLEGKKTDLTSIAGDKPTVLIFYRGGWCPYCNRHLSELAKIEGDLMEMGYQMVAVSPDTPAELNKSVEKNSLKYKLFSDSSAEAAKQFGIAFKVEESLVTKYKNDYKIDLEAASGQKHHILPVPSVFIIKKGMIVYSYSNPDYRVRLKGDEVLAAAKAAM
ncbi:MAG: AhpC/TSA family protein [Fimbriimonadaceae bacterium]|nr:MAG: AhpC/TSA family protein [Fimbriimonadaceae bacterium]